jgi:hypothetical protein
VAYVIAKNIALTWYVTLRNFGTRCSSSCGGAMLFDEGEFSPEMVRFLKAALESPRQAKELSEIVGPEFEQFRKNVLAHVMVTRRGEGWDRKQ